MSTVVLSVEDALRLHRYLNSVFSEETPDEIIDIMNEIEYDLGLLGIISTN